MFLRNICEINFPWKLFYSAPNDLSSDFLDGSLMCPRGLGTDVLMMRVHWLDGWYRPLWSLRRFHWSGTFPSCLDVTSQASDQQESRRVYRWCWTSPRTHALFTHSQSWPLFCAKSCENKRISA